MKKKELKIAELKVQSFVTTMKDQKSETVKGGSWGCGGTNGPQVEICPNTIFPDQSVCDEACITNFPPFCF